MGSAGQLGSWGNFLEGLTGKGAKQITPYIGQELTRAFDPQQAYYNQTLQALTDQTRSAEAARGVANTPYGAAAEGSTLGNFGIDWNRQQLANEQSGLGSAVGAYQGLAGAGATAAQPMEAALGGYNALESTASGAQGQQNQQNLNQQQFGWQQLGNFAGDLGSVAGANNLGAGGANALAGVGKG